MSINQTLLSLLKEMADSPNGLVKAHLVFGGGSKVTRHQHAQLLVDDGLAKWATSRKAMVRITSAGHVFLKNMEHRDP